MIWLFIAWLVTLSVGCLIAYAFGKYWLGYGRFREHLRSIRWSAYAGIPDGWHWGIDPRGLCLAAALLVVAGVTWWSVPLALLLLPAVFVYGNFDAGFHFTSAGMMLRLGPFTCGWAADDTN